jgi:hypothetical protein
MLSGKLHWLTVGLALLVSAGRVHGQLGVPGKPAGQSLNSKTPVRPASYMQGTAPGYEMLDPSSMGTSPGGDMPMHMAMQGPPPMDAMQQGGYCDSGTSCDSMGGILGGGGMFGDMHNGCSACGGQGCFFCGAGNGCIGRGGCLGLLGVLAPYSEGGRGGQRWFDLSVGTIALSRTSGVGSFQTGSQDIVTGAFAQTTLISTLGQAGTPVLYSTDVDANKMRYGLEAIANMQTGPGASVEVRYFGLNKWSDTRTVRNLAAPDLFSVFSLYGTDPIGGFDDTDRSFIHSVSLTSELHSGEVNYRRQFVPPAAWMQGGWLAGIRYLDLDERFGFAATGSRNNAFQFNQLRFFNYDTQTRNQLTGFQVGSNLWLNLCPGLMAGVEGKGGIYGNHAETDTLIVSNSIPSGTEALSDGKTAYVAELTASTVYRLTYSWSFRASYNLLYVDNVALAQENFNTRDLSNAIGSGAFTAARVPFINTDGEATYQGFTLAGEWMF